MEIRMQNIVYILGTGRCGSTLLEMALNAHSHIFSVGEIGNFSNDLNNKMDSFCGCYQPFLKCKFWSTIIHNIEQKLNKYLMNHPENFNTNMLVQLKNPYEKILFRIKLILSLLNIYGFNHHDNGEVFQNTQILYNEIFDNIDQEIITDSYKNQYRSLIFSAKYNKQYNYKFIHLVRDGRAVLNSYLKEQYRIKLDKNNDDRRLTNFSLTPRVREDVITSWWKKNLDILLMYKLFRGKNYFLVRYEDLCLDPEKELNKICNFIGIPFEQAMLKLNRYSNHITRGNPSAKFNAKYIKHPNMEYKDTLSRETLTIFNKKAGWLNNYFGYK